MPTSASLVTNLPADFNTFGQAVDTSMAQLKGGTTGQILSKTSATDMAFTWITNDVGDITAVNTTAPLAGGGTSGALTLSIASATTAVVGAVQLSDSTSTTSSVLAATPTAVKSSYDLAAAAVPKSTVTTAGDVIYATGSSAVTRLGIGTTGQVLTVASGVPSWATPASGSTFVGANVTGASLTAANATATTVAFNAETYDTNAFHDNTTNNNRMTIPSGKAGYYLVTATGLWDANATGRRNFYVRKNGTIIYNIELTPGAATYPSPTFSMPFSLAVADYIDIAIYQTSGTTLSFFDPAFTISYLGA